MSLAFRDLWQSSRMGELPLFDRTRGWRLAAHFVGARMEKRSLNVRRSSRRLRLGVKRR